MTNLPAWITVGAKVAVYDRGATGRVSSFQIRTVSRLLPTQIVLDNGSRFRRGDLYAVGESRAKLLPLTDPDVVNARIQIRITNLRVNLSKLLGARVNDYAAAVALLGEANKMIAETLAGLSRSGLDGA